MFGACAILTLDECYLDLCGRIRFLRNWDRGHWLFGACAILTLDECYLDLILVRKGKFLRKWDRGHWLFGACPILTAILSPSTSPAMRARYVRPNLRVPTNTYSMSLYLSLKRVFPQKGTRKDFESAGKIRDGFLFEYPKRRR